MPLAEPYDVDHPFLPADTFKDDVILVTGGGTGLGKAMAQMFARQYGKTYMLALDTDGRAAIDYGVSGVPETFVINREGVIIHKEAGPVTTAMLEELAAKL